jgi:hypothetical protein
MLDDVSARGVRQALHVGGFAQGTWAAGLAPSLCSPRQRAPAREATWFAQMAPPGERETELVWAELQDPLTLLLSVGACNAENNRATVDETAEAVTVTVVTDDPPGGVDCADGVKVMLDEPLGVRELIDGSTGQAVEVHER